MQTSPLVYDVAAAAAGDAAAQNPFKKNNKIPM